MRRKIKPDHGSKFETHLNPLGSGRIQREMMPWKGHCATESRLVP